MTWIRAKRGRTPVSSEIEAFVDPLPADASPDFDGDAVFVRASRIGAASSADRRPSATRPRTRRSAASRDSAISGLLEGGQPGRRRVDVDLAALEGAEDVEAL